MSETGDEIMAKVSCDNCGRYTNGTIRDNHSLCEDCYFWHYPPCSVCGENKPADQMSGSYLDNDYLFICDQCENTQETR